MKDSFLLYLNRDTDRLKGQIPDQLLSYFSNHWSGNYKKADDLYVDLDNLDEFWTSIYNADKRILQMKMGQDLKELPLQYQNKYTDVIWLYAKLSKYFWIDHSTAMKATLRIALNGLKFPGLGITSMGLFIVGHLLAIKGKWYGFYISKIFHSIIFKMANYRVGVPAFSKNIVFSCFPYTCFLSKKFNTLKKVVSSNERFVSDEIYYKNIFLTSQLYAYSYSGDVSQSEIVAERLAFLSKAGPMWRYRTIAPLLVLLPIAFRGYILKFIPEVSKTINIHKDEEFDPLINSQFYRTAAVIYYSLNQFEKSQEYITKAIHFRKQTKSFHAWSDFDEKVLLGSTSEKYDSSILSVFGGATNSSHELTFGSFMLDLFNLIPNLGSTDFDFSSRCIDLLAKYLQSQNFKVFDSVPIKEDIGSTTIKVHEKFVVFYDIDRNDNFLKKEFLDSCLPTLKVLEEVKRLSDEQYNLEKYKAIAQTTQMLAHDVRKPFSSITAGLSLIEKAKSLTEMSNIVPLVRSSVDRSLANVNGMLTDIMELGQSSRLKLEKFDPGEIIANSLEEMTRVFKDKGIFIHLDYNHKNILLCDNIKLQRVFSNILANAIQAMKNHGNIYIQTEENSMYLEVKVKNEGSYLPPEKINKLFDAFYTDKKRGGTGLGLAIAKKIVELHKGKIEASSDRNANTVTFRILLPNSNQSCEKSIRKYVKPIKLKKFSQLIESDRDNANHSFDFETQMKRFNTKYVTLGRKIRISVLDDEQIYRDSAKALVSDLALSSRFEISTFSNPAELLNSNLDSIDFLITDVDLENESFDGYEVVSELKNNKAFLGSICIHSNKALLGDFAKAFEVGADAFLPKPMTPEHFLKFINDSGFIQ